MCALGEEGLLDHVLRGDAAARHAVLVQHEDVEPVLRVVLGRVRRPNPAPPISPPSALQWHMC